MTKITEYAIAQAVLSAQPNSEMATIPSNYSRIIGRELGLTVRDLPKLLQFTALTTQQFMQEDTLLTAKQLIQILHNGIYLSEAPGRA